MITNSKLGKFYFYCKICKDISCSHGAASDLVRHCNLVTHQKKGRRLTQTSLGYFACKKNSSRDILTRKAKLSLQDSWLNIISQHRVCTNKSPLNSLTCRLWSTKFPGFSQTFIWWNQKSFGEKQNQISSGRPEAL